MDEVHRKVPSLKRGVSESRCKHSDVPAQFPAAGVRESSVIESRAGASLKRSRLPN